MEITVVGAGYVGAVTASCLAFLGHDVTILEASAARLETLRGGTVPFYEPGLDEKLSEGLRAGRITVTDDAKAALSGREALLVCVGTPLSKVGDADLRQVKAACRSIAEHGGDAVVIIRSTLPLGSSPQLAEWLGRPELDGVVTNPEFLREGTAVADFLRPTRIVIGTRDGSRDRGALIVEALYAGIDAPLVVTDLGSAEMIKNASNAFLATKLSFINEIADLCEAYGADVNDVVLGMGLDPRIGSTYLRPGIGFGGSCLPKELANLVRLGRDRNMPMHMLGSAGDANDERPSLIADRIATIVGELVGQRVALLGLAFKPDTDDIRYSPAVALAVALIDRGATVTAHDPAVSLAQLDDVAGLDRAASAEDAIRGAAIVVLATEWQAYRDLDWAALRDEVGTPIVFDGRNALDEELLGRAGWQVYRVGAAGGSRAAAGVTR